MSKDAAPERIAIIWSPEARADLRTIERGTAMQILHCVGRYLVSRTGGEMGSQTLMAPGWRLSQA